MSDRQAVVIDTNVIIDAFLRSRDLRSRSSVEILRAVDRGDFLGILPAPVLIEIYYVVLDITKDPKRAQKVVGTLLGSRNMRAQSIDREHAMAAMDIYRDTNYFHLGHGDKLGKRDENLSVVDCVVLAVGKCLPGSIVCSNESKFSRIKGVRTMKPWELVGLEEKVEEGASPH